MSHLLPGFLITFHLTAFRLLKYANLRLVRTHYESNSILQQLETSDRNILTLQWSSRPSNGLHHRTKIAERTSWFLSQPSVYQHPDLLPISFGTSDCRSQST